MVQSWDVQQHRPAAPHTQHRQRDCENREREHSPLPRRMVCLHICDLHGYNHQTHTPVAQALFRCCEHITDIFKCSPTRPLIVTRTRSAIREPGVSFCLQVTSMNTNGILRRTLVLISSCSPPQYQFVTPFSYCHLLPLASLVQHTHPSSLQLNLRQLGGSVANMTQVVPVHQPSAITYSASAGTGKESA